MHYCIASSKKTTAQPNLAERRRTSRRGLHYTRRSTRAAAQQRTTAQAPGRQLALWSSHAAPLPPSSHRVRLRRTRLSLSLSPPLNPTLPFFPSPSLPPVRAAELMRSRPWRAPPRGSSSSPAAPTDADASLFSFPAPCRPPPRPFLRRCRYLPASPPQRR